jgi:tape measure domain-containing protein
MATKIASFAAELELKVKNLQALKDFERKMSDLPKEFKRIKAAQISLNSSIRAGAADMARMTEATKKLAAARKKMAAMNDRAGSMARNSAAARARAASDKIRGQGRERSYDIQANRARNRAANIRRNLEERFDMGANSGRGRRDSIRRNLEERSDVGDHSDRTRRDRTRRGLEERSDLDLHNERTRDFARNQKLEAARLKAAATLARIQAAAAARELAAAQRTAAIREAGARRAAAIIEAGERRAAAIREAANRRTGGAAGGRGGHFGRAGMGGALGAAGSGIAGFLPGFGGAFALSKVNSINQEIQGQGMAMQAVTGSVGAGAEQQAFVKNLANTVGLDYRNITPNYTKMLASGLGSGMKTEDVQTIFKGTAEYGRVMGLNPEAMQGSMRALEQMMNKGQVMSEELKGQFAERMPGAVSMMAEAAGFGTGSDAPSKLFKAMEKGQVKSNDVLVKLANIMAAKARNGDALAKAMQSTAAEQQRFNNDVTDMIVIMSGAGADKGFGNMFKSFSKFLKENTDGVAAFGVAIEKLSIFIGKTLDGLTNIGILLEKIAKNFNVSNADVLIFIATLTMLATGFGKVAAFAYGLFTILEDISVGLQGGESYTKDFLDFLKDNAWAEVGAKTAAFAIGLGLIASQILAIATGITAVGAAGGAGGLIGGLLGIISAHPVIAALILATIALNTAHDVYADRAAAHLQDIKSKTDLPTQEAITRLTSAPSVDTMNPDFYRDYPSGVLPGVNTPMMMVDKISIEVKSSGNAQETADAVLVAIKKFASNAAKDMTVPE